jgi:catechol 2,3-dioxygenase-like lactoylglutathione lyase family enzyme
MKVKGRFDHFNINVTDLDKSIKFYETALGLHIWGHYLSIYLNHPTLPPPLA